MQDNKGNWMQEFKDAWYSDNEIKNKREKDELWKEVERHANTAYKYFFKHLKNNPSPVHGISKEWRELTGEVIDMSSFSHSDRNHIKIEVCGHGNYISNNIRSHDEIVFRKKESSPSQTISKEGEKRYLVQTITDANAPNGIHYRITDNNGDNRIATSYWKDHAEMICNALNASLQTEEQKLFTLVDALKIWEAAVEYEYRSQFGKVPTDKPNRQQYFKERFSIDI